MNPTLPRIALDARALSHPQAGGFRTSVRALLRGLIETGAAGEQRANYLLYLDRPLADAVPLPGFIQTRVLSTNRLKSDLILFRRQVRRDAPDLVHGTTNYLPPLPVRTTLTIHDALGIQNYPFAQNPPIRRTPREILIYRYTRLQTVRSSRAAHALATDSRASAAEIAAVLKIPIDRLKVVYHGIALPPPTLHRENRTICRRTILALASPDPRKNLDCLYRALTTSWGDTAPPNLQIVCANPNLAARTTTALTECGITDFTILCGLDNDALANAYAAADIFVFPSQWEGFGLPPLEAMQSGCPVIASCAPALPEVLGDIPLYFDPEQPESLAGAIRQLLNHPDARQMISKAGIAHAARFTCAKMADAMRSLWWEAMA